MLICAISAILCRPNRNLQDTGTSLKTYNDSVSIIFGLLSWVNSTSHEIYCSFVLLKIDLIHCYLQFPTTSLPVNPHQCSPLTYEVLKYSTYQNEVKIIRK